MTMDEKFALHAAGSRASDELPRRIMQICATSSSSDGADIVYALANDGSLWHTVLESDPIWIRLPDLPQPI